MSHYDHNANTPALQPNDNPNPHQTPDFGRAAQDARVEAQAAFQAKQLAERSAFVDGQSTPVLPVK